MSKQPRLITKFGDVFYAFEKPEGMASHQNAEESLDLVRWIKKQKSLPHTLRPAHRLDLGTSGIVLCGAGRKARAQISAWIQDDATKEYMVLVAGAPEKDEGKFTTPLFDRNKKKTQPCETIFRVQERLNGFTLIEVELVTGRKHQIRRHLAAAGMPVVGDKRYGPKKPKRVPGFPNRLWLHAWRLTIPGKVIESPLPEELQAHLQLLRAKPSES
jgi:23S rRNA-/tRNA-specific pseudouridylate synthase